ncbi:hypothetical protein PGT21_022431 [Puccinia graminis f. sp. tritici]|uniref:Protein-lysine N-methyltransferase EFM4 n=2 Tax=Puccinia graminis f. sp. tritici TaxID=56615 RepID=E3L4D4_PUCGT|nr:uncharacterized protein PGTG_17365 [Puccinia graminis f. sp. tritici CRL 75-36-700-3]EFP91409.1 hypothetical protein PGTG_17365 [Puccinia graminis f. sp. tritici CRL 75-36-700-3]KAA1108708.1 hypothetical protein PGT21_022431 [Puccinia graminis f. sp. tritici]
MTDDGGTIEVESLVPSRLGTQAYWDDNYGRELSNFCEAGDEGEVWFGEASSDEILDWIARYLPSPMTPTKLSFSTGTDEDGQLPGPLGNGRTDSQILDVGCGNGQLLFLLAQGGYSVDCLTGVDYSASSIELTSQIARAKGIQGLRLEVRDVLRDTIEPPHRTRISGSKGWDLITDKGTFDAICLSEETIDGKKLETIYPEKIFDLLVKPGGIFLITSCNWTEEELIKKFVSPNIGFKFHSKIPRACFSFGGSKGSTITTIAFQTCS